MSHKRRTARAGLCSLGIPSNFPLVFGLNNSTPTLSSLRPRPSSRFQPYGGLSMTPIWCSVADDTPLRSRANAIDGRRVYPSSKLLLPIAAKRSPSSPDRHLRRQTERSSPKHGISKTLLTV